MPFTSSSTQPLSSVFCSSHFTCSAMGYFGLTPEAARARRVMAAAKCRWLADAEKAARARRVMTAAKRRWLGMMRKPLSRPRQVRPSDVNLACNVALATVHLFLSHFDFQTMTVFCPKEAETWRSFSFESSKNACVFRRHVPFRHVPFS